MARTPADRSRPVSALLREQLAEAPAFLKQAGAPAYIAEALGTVLAPGGWEHLRASDPLREEGSSNLAISMPKSMRDQIKAAHAAEKAAAEEAGVSVMSLTARANEGFLAYLEGRFTPAVRPSRVQSEERANLNVTASTALQRQVAEKVAASVSDARKGAAWVASEWLMSVYGLGPYAPGARPVLARGDQRNLQMPQRIRDLVRERASAAGDKADAIIEEGWQKFLDGEFEPQPVEWRDEDREQMSVLRVHPNNELFARVKEASRGVPGLGALYGPSRVAIDYLLDQLGIDPEAPADAVG